MYNSASTGRGEKSALFDGPEHVKRLKSATGRGEKSALFDGEEHMMRLKSSEGRGEKSALFDGQERVACLKSSRGVATAAKAALFDGTDFNDRLRVAGAANKLTLFHGLHERSNRKARGGHPSFKCQGAQLLVNCLAQPFVFSSSASHYCHKQRSTEGAELPVYS